MRQILRYVIVGFGVNGMPNKIILTIYVVSSVIGQYIQLLYILKDDRLQRFENNLLIRADLSLLFQDTILLILLFLCQNEIKV